jgi:hypothetical protein
MLCGNSPSELGIAQDWHGMLIAEEIAERVNEHGSGSSAVGAVP